MIGFPEPGRHPGPITIPTATYIVPDGDFIGMEKPRIAVPKDKIAAFCRKNHIRRFSLFGSVLRPDFRQDSDVDVLVEFEPGKGPGYFGLFDMEEELSGILGGRKVDMRTPKEISRYFRQDVIESAVVEYTA
jgi:predicted nucleotidyltransferase